MAVFTTANHLADARLYRVLVASPTGGSVACNSGPAIDTQHCRKLRFGPHDTVLVIGAYADRLRVAMRDATIAATLRDASRRAGRYGSVCTGTFILGAAGLVDGRRVATHWAACPQLGAAFSAAEVQSDALYVEDGRLWTSAGVSTGVDMALAMLERDHGPVLAGRVARQLVLYLRRPGHQSQFSSVLDAQQAGDGVFSRLVEWLESRTEDAVRVEDMAAQVGMSPRTFHRKFTEVMGDTPARYLERRRLEFAKRLLEAGHPVKVAAKSAGFRSESAFRTAFSARFGTTPSHHARMHRK